MLASVHYRLSRKEQPDAWSTWARLGSDEDEPERPEATKTVGTQTQWTVDPSKKRTLRTQTDKDDWLQTKTKWTQASIRKGGTNVQTQTQDRIKI